MERKNQPVDFELMARFLSRETGREETSRFEHWLDINPENREIFRQYKLLWEQMGKVKSLAGLDLDEEWKKLEARLQKADTDPAIRRIKPYRLVPFLIRVAAAAGVVLVFSLGGIYISRNTGYRSCLTENQTREIVLPDGSGVTLNAHSGIRYKKNFSQDLRSVTLEGEAFFEVEGDENRPFVISVDGVEVRVLGTSFNVKAYKDHAGIEVTVSTGRVALTKPGEVPESIILKPGNKGIFSRTDHSLTITREIDRNYLSWKTRSFIFEDRSLLEVVQILNRVYCSNIVIMSDSLKNARITTSFNNQTLDAIMNVLSATLDLKVEDTGDRILLTGGI